MKRFVVGKTHMIVLGLLLLSSFMMQQPANASPFGQGLFGADVPFGSETSIAIALGGNAALGLTPSGPNFSGTGSHTLTVTSTDVVGYKLYAFSPTSTTMTNGSDTIPASSNSSPSTLAVNTWGYNTTGSTTNFTGMLTTPSLIKDASGPYKNGDDTTITYGALTDITKSAGDYTVGVVYTVVAENE